MKWTLVHSFDSGQSSESFFYSQYIPLLWSPAIPDVPVKPRILGGKSDNSIPEPVVTESPRFRQQPFDYDGEIYVGPPEQTTTLPEEEEEEEEEEDEEDDTGNLLNPRGDAFCEWLLLFTCLLRIVLNLLTSDRII